jgi:hypothetical protein
MTEQKVFTVTVKRFTVTYVASSKKEQTVSIMSSIERYITVRSFFDCFFVRSVASKQTTLVRATSPRCKEEMVVVMVSRSTESSCVYNARTLLLITNCCASPPRHSCCCCCGVLRNGVANDIRRRVEVAPSVAVRCVIFSCVGGVRRDEHCDRQRLDIFIFFGSFLIDSELSSLCLPFWTCGACFFRGRCKSTGTTNCSTKISIYLTSALSI